MNERLLRTYAVASVSMMVVIGAPLQVLGGTYVLYATATASDPGWTNAAAAAGVPEDPDCNTTNGPYAFNSFSGAPYEWSWLYATDFDAFTPPANEVITKVEVDVYCRYTSGSDGYIGVNVNFPSLGVNHYILSPAFHTGDGNCNWRVGANGDITGLFAQWTPALINELLPAVHRPVVGLTTLRVKAFRITVTTCAGTVYYSDGDHDGYGNAGIPALACSQPPNYVTNNADCDDANPNVHPGAHEACNNIDDNCVNGVDEGVTTTFYRDVDGDGYGNPAVSLQACSLPAGYVANAFDCNDEDNTVACPPTLPILAWDQPTATMHSCAPYRTPVARLALDGSGSVYVAAASSGINGCPDYATVKYNEAGAEQWRRTYNGSTNGDDQATALAVSRTGRVFVSGYSFLAYLSESYPSVVYDSLTGQSLGEIDSPFQGNSSNRNTDALMVTDWAGNAYAATRYTLGKYDASLQWLAQASYAASGYAITSAATWVDTDSNVYVTGSAYNATTGNDYIVLKYGPGLNLLWTARYGATSTSGDVPVAIITDAAGNVYVTGSSGTSSTLGDYATVKFNSLGSKQWDATYDGPAHSFDVPAAIALDANGNVYVTGYSTGVGTGRDILTIKYNGNGVEQWTNRYDGPLSADDAGTSMALDSAGNIYVTGSCDGLGSGGKFATIMYTPSGVRQWVARYVSPFGQAYAVAVRPGGECYVAGDKNIGEFHTLNYRPLDNGSGVKVASNSDVFLQSPLLLRSGTLQLRSTWLYGNGKVELCASALLEVGGDTANAAASRIGGTVSITGLGEVHVLAGQQMTLENTALLDLSETGGQKGKLTIDGTLLVQDQAVVRNSNVEVRQAQITSDQPVQNNDISMMDSTYSGGQFYVQDSASVLDNVITSEGDRYLDLDPVPDPAHPSNHPTINRNTLRVNIVTNRAYAQGTLLELRSRDDDCGTATNPACTSGPHPASIGQRFAGENAENWVLETLEIGQTLTDSNGQRTEVSGKLNLTNRPGLVFAPVRHLPDGRLVPETVYVRNLVLHSNSVLNTGLQALYFENLWLVSEQHAKTQWSGTLTLPITLPNGSEIVDQPLLGFSLGIIAFNDTKDPPFNEFDLRVRTRTTDPTDFPTCQCLGIRVTKPPICSCELNDPNCDPSNNPPPLIQDSTKCRVGQVHQLSAEQVQQQIPMLTQAGGGMEMRTAASFRLSTNSVACKGSFTRAGDENITIAFDYLLLDNPNAQIVVKLSDNQEVGKRSFEVARVHMPLSGRPGSIGSNQFGTFYATFPRQTGNYTLDFVRGTYVELELRGLSSRVWIDNFDPQVICSSQCADLSGEGGVSGRDYLLLLAESGQTLRQASLSKVCMDTKLSEDQYIDMTDVLAFDTLVSGTPPPNACGPLAPPTGNRPGAKTTGESRSNSPMLLSNTSSTLTISGKSTMPGQQSDGLYTLSKATASCLGSGTSAPAGGAGTRANGRLVTDSTGSVYQLNGAAGLVKIGGSAVVPPRYFSSVATESGTAKVHVGVNAPSGIYSGLPLADAAFSPTDPNIVYVVPVLVAPTTGCPYKAAAKLQLTGNGNYNVLMLYGRNPGSYSTVQPDSELGCEFYVPEPDRNSLREIEVDGTGHVFVLSAQAASPSNDWLLVYNESAGNASEHAELLSVAGPTAMLVSSTNRLYLASSVDALATQTRIYRFDIGCYSGSGTCLSALSPITINNPTDPVQDHGYGYFARITAMKEDPADGRIYVTGFTAPRFSATHTFSGSESLFTMPTLVSFTASSTGPVPSNAIDCHDLALPLSMVFGSGFAAADFNQDGHVDSTDFGHFKDCATRAGVSYVPLSAGCTMPLDAQNHISADFDNDGDVDIDDFGVLQKAYAP